METPIPLLGFSSTLLYQQHRAGRGLVAAHIDRAALHAAVADEIDVILRPAEQCAHADARGPRREPIRIAPTADLFPLSTVF